MLKPAAILPDQVGSTLAPVARQTLGDSVLETVRKAIIAGAFAPGDHLAEATLAQQLGVSRAPVREAMMQLEREGLLHFDRRGAALVTEFSEDDFAEIFSLRLTLETAGARFFCRNAQREHLELLEENIERTRTASKLIEITLLDVQFHDLIMQGAGHSRLYGCWSGLRHQIEVWLARRHSARPGSVRQTREETIRHHERLVAALRARNEEAAANALHAHIESWGCQYPRTAPDSAKRHG